MVRIEREQYSLAWSLENTSDSPISEIDENHKLYKNVYQDVDLDYSLSENKLKETVVLNSKSSQKEFTVNYYLKDLTPYQTDGKTIELLNKNQKCVYTISAPKMLDAAGKSCENLNLEILNSENDKLKVKIVCDQSWLEEKERVYPIFVDPDYTYESFDYQVSAHPAPFERVFRTNWRKKDTGESVFLNLVGSDFSGLGVVKVQVFGKNSRGEENCTYETQCYFLEANKQYELYNKINEKGYSEVQLRFICSPGDRIRGFWSPDYKSKPDTFTIGAWGDKSRSKKQNSSDNSFRLRIKPNRHCWVSFRTKATSTSVYLALEGSGERVNVEIWGLGGENFNENCTNRCQQYSLTLGKRYELYNTVNERHHTAVRLKFEGEPGTEIVGRWSPDFNEKWEREHNPGWTLLDGSGKEKIVGGSPIDSVGTPIRPIANPQALVRVPQISQVGEFPTGCESVSAVMVLHFYEYDISVREFIDKYLIKKSISDRPDPNSAFVGSPYDTHSYGCFAPCIAKAMNKVLRGAHAEVIRGKNLRTLSEEYTRNGVPILIWVTMGMRKTKPTVTWTIDYTDENARYQKGEKFTWPGNEHCVVLIGFNERDYFVNDPLQSKDKVQGAYEKSLMEERFREQGSQAVVVCKDSLIDRHATLGYAMKWWSSHNPEYPCFDRGDCANFVSQCIHAGGIRMNSNWYCRKKDDAGIIDKLRNRIWDYSSKWSVARDNYEYFKNSGIISEEVILENAEKIPEITKGINPVRIGDIMYLQWDKPYPHHAVIVSKVEAGKIFYAAHTEARDEEPLSNFFGNYEGGRVYILKIK